MNPLWLPHALPSRWCSLPLKAEWGTSQWSTYVHFVSVSYCCITKHPQKLLDYNNSHLFIISHDSVVCLGSAWRFFWSMWCWPRLEGPRGSPICLAAWAAYHLSISLIPPVACPCDLGSSQLGSWTLRGNIPRATAKAEDLLRASFRGCTVCSVGQN